MTNKREVAEIAEAPQSCVYINHLYLINGKVELLVFLSIQVDGGTVGIDYKKFLEKK